MGQLNLWNTEFFTHHITSIFLNAVFHKFSLVRRWILRFRQPHLNATSFPECWISLMELLACWRLADISWYSGCVGFSTREGWLLTLRKYWSACKIKTQRGHSFSACEKFSENQYFLPSDKQMYVCVSGG